MNATTPITIVSIDDDPLQLKLLQKRLKDPDPALDVREVFTYTEAAEAMANMPADGPVAILCDFDMPDGSGLDWLTDLVRLDIGPVLMLTATGSEKVAARAFREGAYDYLLKNVVLRDIRQLKHAIADAMRRFNLAKRNKRFARELKLANKQLIERNLVLTEMTKTAHRFVDNVAHDFRTPLTVIREFASILNDGIVGEVNEKQTEFLNYIDASAQDLNAMVDDFLDSSKLKAQTMRVSRSAARIQELIERIKPTLETRAQSKSIDLDVEIAPDTPEVFIDTEKIGRVLINLVINAIKFSSEGSKIRITAKPDGKGQVFIAVSDQGMGIAEDELSKVCERFMQVGDPRRSIAKGFGLGLNIARDLIWINLGTMRITSELGKGSVFGFTVPANEPTQVVKQYLQRVCESDETSAVSLLRISPYNPDVQTSELVDDLTTASRSLDLLLPSGDDRTIYVIGPTDQPDLWMQRLKDATQAGGERRDQPNPLNIAWLGTWPQGSAQAPIIDLINQHDQEEKACA